MVDLERNVMMESTLSLIVPVENRLRDEIRRKTDSFILTHKTLPPVSYNKLTEFADILVAENNWDRSYKAFVMVCCGNAVWRSVVGSVPYNKRMLLLPQCLKDSHKCRGTYDELGLLCSECGNCNISGFLHEAEDLGYITIVTEGTTIASRLVEQGNVDAIIGVGCMEVLQKMFGAVRKYSVPAIGVPLLTCGCIDTTADSAWIREEIRHLDTGSGFRLLNINNLGEKTNSLFTGENIRELLRLKGSDTDKMILELLLAGGKRIRPLLTVLAYEAFSKNPVDDLLKNLSMSVECFHKASLIHDDIEDNDSFRYGKETIHSRHGIPVAINIGDLLIGEGYRLLAESGLNAEVLRECIRIVSGVHVAMSAGQGDELLARRNKDILPVGQILDIFHNKTSEAFRVSLLLGAIAGGADDRSLDILDRVSHLIGLAYQMKDDLEDFTDEKESGSLKNPSIVISMLYEKADEPDRIEIRAAVSAENNRDLLLLIKKYSIKGLVAENVKTCLEKTVACLENLQNTSLKLALHEIVGKTFRDYV